jgi:hypothetical protein
MRVLQTPYEFCGPRVYGIVVCDEGLEVGDAAADLVHVVSDALEFERDFVGGYVVQRCMGGCVGRCRWLVDYDWTVLVRGGAGALEWVRESHHVSYGSLCSWGW